MIENPGSFVASVDPAAFETGLGLYNSICLEFTIQDAYPTYQTGDRMNYTLIDEQLDEYVFAEIIYTPNGTIHQEGNYTVTRSELRLPLFMTTTNITLIQELFSTNADWNYTYDAKILIFQQTAYDYPELGDVLYSEYIYDGILGWLISLYQKSTAANQTVMSEVRLNAVGVALPTTTVETTEPSSESTTIPSSTTQDSTTTKTSIHSTTTTTIPNISSFPGLLESLGVLGILFVIYRRKR
ncbi:MAG: hypothetical protein ACXACW_07365 [Candidatus Hodarchaeales archaeon]|jgi:hypothetical protein